MFNMENVGLKIAELRKKRNMTQMELADKMGISFQAVSNWERGNSMPDISKLPELAEVFGVTIDELLGEDSKAVKSAINGEIHEYIKQSEDALREVIRIAPILPPRQIEETLANSEIHSLHDIEELLPFVGEDIANAIAMKEAERGNYRDLDIVAPFVSQGVISDIARKMVAENKNIADIAPFVSEKTIGELARKIYEASGLRKMEDIAPFIPKEDMKKIAEMEYKIRGLRDFDRIAPFLDGEYLNAIAREAVEKEGIKAISNIAPFLDKNMLGDYIKEKYL